MSSVIEFLERMGEDARLRHASLDEVAVALTEAHIEPELQEAILAKDAFELWERLGIKPLFSVQLPAEEEEEEQDDDEEDDPSLEASGLVSRSVLHASVSVA